MKTKTIGFDIELAKKIQNGEAQGRIKTKDGKDVRIICTDKASTDDNNKTQIVCLIRLGAREFVSINDPNTGQCWDIEDGNAQHLFLEIPDDTQEEYRFKPFDKVLVRDSDEDKWTISLYSYADIGRNMYLCLTEFWEQCIPYEGNEHLLGTTDPEEED